MDNMSDCLKKYMNERNWTEQYQLLIQQAMADDDVQAFIEEHEDRLSDESLIRSAANIYEFVQEKNKAKQQAKTLAPGYQPQLVINKNHIDVTYVPTASKQAAIEQEKKKQRVSTFHMPKHTQDVALTDVDMTQERVPLMDAILQFIEELTDDPQLQNYHPGLYIHGPFGVGKTFILSAMANELATYHFHSVLAHLPSFFHQVKQSISSNTTGEVIAPLKEADILVLDDIGAESFSTWERDDVLGVILQHRMQEEKTTFFTSNLTLEDLESHLTYPSRGEADPLKAKRLIERVKFLARPIELKGSNRRHSS